MGQVLKQMSINAEVTMETVLQLVSNLEELARSIVSLPDDDRVLFYQKVSPLILRLKGELKLTQNVFAARQVEELEWHLTTIARLEDPDGDSDDQHLQKLLGNIGALRSPQGFGGS
jgi:hypothetical protein